MKLDHPEGSSGGVSVWGVELAGWLDCGKLIPPHVEIRVVAVNHNRS